MRGTLEGGRTHHGRMLSNTMNGKRDVIKNISTSYKQNKTNMKRLAENQSSAVLWTMKINASALSLFLAFFYISLY